MIKEGSRWSASDSKVFVVLHIIEQDGHTWVHYRNEGINRFSTEGCQEYSCYEESFRQRFTEIVNDNRA